VSLWFLTDAYECGQREYQGELLISLRVVFFPPLAVSFEGFNRDIQTTLVSVFEAVRDRFSGETRTVTSVMKVCRQPPNAGSENQKVRIGG
jgi:hypothetical protein